MSWVLLLVWTASYVTTTETIEFQSRELCEGAARHIQMNWTPPQGRQDTKLSAYCVQVQVTNNEVK